MNIKLKFSKNLQDFLKTWFDINNGIQKWLTQATLLIQNSAKDNAPYDKWNLRRSIGSDYSRIKQGIVRVWSDVKYANIREYINNKNPHRKFYFKRAVDDNKDEITKIIENSFKNLFW